MKGTAVLRLPRLLLPLLMQRCSAALGFSVINGLAMLFSILFGFGDLGLRLPQGSLGCVGRADVSIPLLSHSQSLQPTPYIAIGLTVAPQTGMGVSEPLKGDSGQ